MVQTQHSPKWFPAIARSHFASGVAVGCLVAWLLACDNGNPVRDDDPEPEPVWTSMGFANRLPLELELDSPYLYACAADEGLFRLDLTRTETDWQYVGLADTSLSDTPFGHNSWRGVQDVTVLGNGVILAGLVSGIDDFSGIYRSSDHGTSWVSSDTGIRSSTYPRASSVLSIEKDPCDPNVVFAGTDGAIYRSEDAGSTWARVWGEEQPGIRINDIRIHPIDCNIAWAGGMTNRLWEALLKSEDHGLTWEWIDLLDVVIHDNAVFHIAPHPRNSAVVYLGMLWAVIKTTDGGNSWIFAGFSHSRMVAYRAITIDESDPDHIYASHTNLVFESLDGGGTAELIESPIETNITDLIYDRDSQSLYVATLNGVYKYGASGS